MVKFNLEGLDKLEELGDGAFGNFIASFGALAMFFAILIAIGIIVLWVFSSIGLMNLAKKNNIANPWLVFIPVGRSYIIGKLGFEVYGKENKDATNFMWITLALGAATFVLGNSNGDLSKLIDFALLFFESWAFYNMFKALKPKSAVVYTVFTAITDTLLGGLFLYLLKPEDEVSEAQIISEKKNEEEIVESDKETKKTKTTKSNVKFCSNCGEKVQNDAKYCSECGKKVN